MNIIMIAAGGKGERANLGYNKIFARIGDHPVIYWTILIFERHPMIDKIVLLIAESDIEQIQKLIETYQFKKIEFIIPASSSRQSTVLNGLHKIAAHSNDLVGIHNAVNPFVTDVEITKVFEHANLYGAAILAQQAVGTLKEVDKNNEIKNTIAREHVWYAQTPQVAIFEHLYKAYQKADLEQFMGTDDSQLLERIDIYPKIVKTSSMNFKITHEEDILMANALLPFFLKIRKKVYV